MCCLSRYEKQLEQEEQAYQQQRRRLYTEVQEEKERLAEQIQKVKNETTQEKSASEVAMFSDLRIVSGLLPVHPLLLLICEAFLIMTG